NVSIPQSVWWMRMISVVASSRCEITSERIASSLTTPPALRITCASPSSRPRILCTSSRASMHATTASFLAGGIGRWPFSKPPACFSLLRSNASVVLTANTSNGDGLRTGCWCRTQPEQMEEEQRPRSTASLRVSSIPTPPAMVPPRGTAGPRGRKVPICGGCGGAQGAAERGGRGMTAQETVAADLEAAAAEVASFIRECPEEIWTARSPHDGRSVASLAYHCAAGNDIATGWICQVLVSRPILETADSHNAHNDAEAQR